MSVVNCQKTVGSYVDSIFSEFCSDRRASQSLSGPHRKYALFGPLWAFGIAGRMLETKAN